MPSNIPTNTNVHVPVKWERGDLATYMGYFSGPIPCRVLGKVSRMKRSMPAVYIVVQFTGGDRRGSLEMIQVAGYGLGTCGSVFTRNRVRVSNGKYVPTVHLHDVDKLPEWTRENFPKIHNLIGMCSEY